VPAGHECDALREERDALRAERDALRARLEAMERERAAEVARASAVVAAAQERVYWIDRFGLDLNAVMASPRAVRLRALARPVRGPLRRLLGVGRPSRA
jgi:hypothetical protein